LEDNIKMYRMKLDCGGRNCLRFAFSDVEPSG